MVSALVSIIAPCYNGEKYIINFLESILNQTYKNIELILIDDGSTDSTASIVKKYIERFNKNNLDLILIQQETNKGAAAAINKGLELFSGEYMMWMDSDDILLPDAIYEKVEFLKKEDVEFALCEGLIVNESDVTKTVGILKREKPLKNDNLFFDYIHKTNVVWGAGTIIVKSSSLKRALPKLHIYESREGQNAQMMLPLAYMCTYGYIKKPLFKYVIHDDSHSHRNRNYEQLILRAKEAFLIAKNTLLNIESMPMNEKDYWINESYIVQLREMYHFALEHYRICDIVSYKLQLVQHNQHICFNERFFPYYCKKMLSQMKKFFCR